MFNFCVFLYCFKGFVSQTLIFSFLQPLGSPRLGRIGICETRYWIYLNALLSLTWVCAMSEVICVLLTSYVSVLFRYRLPTVYRGTFIQSFVRKWSWLKWHAFNSTNPFIFHCFHLFGSIFFLLRALWIQTLHCGLQVWLVCLSTVAFIFRGSRYTSIHCCILSTYMFHSSLLIKGFGH